MSDRRKDEKDGKGEDEKDGKGGGGGGGEGEGSALGEWHSSSHTSNTQHSPFHVD